jgi:galactokinase/mevalonate kinase-like predicted kinase
MFPWLTSRRLVGKTASYLHGYSMCGAGGGGFMYLLLKDASQAETVRGIISGLGSDSLAFHEAAIDAEGLAIWLQDD